MNGCLRGVVDNTLVSINVIALHRARLLPGNTRYWKRVSRCRRTLRGEGNIAAGWGIAGSV